MTRRTRSRPRRFAQVDGQALLVRVERGEDRAPLPVPVLGLGDTTDEAGPVGTGGGLEVDDLGAEERQHVTREGPGPERRHVEDPEALEGQLARAAVRRGPHRLRRRRRLVSVQLAQAGCRFGRPQTRRTRTGRAGAGWRAVPGIGHECPALGEVRPRRGIRSVRNGCVGDPEGRRLFQHLLDGALRDPGVDGGRQGGAIEEQRPVLHPLGVSHQHAEVQPLLSGPAPEPDEPVAAPPRRRASPRTASGASADPAGR